MLSHVRAMRSAIAGMIVPASNAGSPLLCLGEDGAESAVVFGFDAGTGEVERVVGGELDLILSCTSALLWSQAIELGSRPPMHGWDLQQL